MKKKLFIFSNESILSNEGKFFCDNIDMKTTPEGLNKKFDVNLFGRKTKKNKSHEIKLKKTKIFTNIFSYISAVIESSKQEEAKYLIISISPYTFFVSIFLRIFGTSNTALRNSVWKVCGRTKSRLWIIKIIGVDLF